MMARLLLVAPVFWATTAVAQGGQVPFLNSTGDIPISARDRFYTADQFSNTVSVIDPSTNRLLGVIRLGDTMPHNLSPLYKGQLLVHGMGFSPDRKTLVVVSVGSNSVTFIDTATNLVKHTTYVGRAPHEAFFTPDGREVWVTVRGEDYVAVIDARSFAEIHRIKVPIGPGMTIFSPDGRYGYVCSSFTPETVVIETRSRTIVGRVRQESPFCPNIAATPDGKQVWLTLKDSGRVMVFEARPPFRVLKTIATGAITNHVNFVRTAEGQRAYVTVGTENVVKVFNTGDYEQIATIPVGSLPHGLWPSGDGSRIYVGLENDDSVAVIDTRSNRVVASVPVGQGPQGVAYVPSAVPTGDGRANLSPLATASQKVELTLSGQGRTQVTLFDQGQLQILQAAAAGLAPTTNYILALSSTADGAGVIEPLVSFTTNIAGAAIVIAAGPLRRIGAGVGPDVRRYLVIRSMPPDTANANVQLQDAGPVSQK